MPYDPTIPREEIRMSSRSPDFEAEVRFLSPEEGGRKGSPRQGYYRPDIRYKEDPAGQSWMVWPRFIDDDGHELQQGAVIQQISKACFYVINDELRKTVHGQRIREGVRFHLCEGQRRVAECTVTKILSLHDDGD